MRKREAAPKPAPLKDPSEIPDDELDAAHAAFSERAKSWPKRKREAGYQKFVLAFKRRRANDLRVTCNLFRFWLACPDKVCGRNKSCSGNDAHACFDRFWPLVPERLKFEYRGLVLALNDGLSPEEAVRKVQADWARMETLARERGKGPAAGIVAAAAEQTRAANAATPPPAQPENAAAPPAERPRGPRVRVL